MSLALFDLDNTLLGGDSDYLWGRFLAERGLVDSEHYDRENQRFYEEYLAGTLDIDRFLRFQLYPLSQHGTDTLCEWREQFLDEMIEPIMLPDARELLQRHRDDGDTLVIITATNRFITGPIAERFNVDHLLATEPEMLDGRYTGGVSGTPCFQDGKLVHLKQWLEQHGETLESSWFYSDSHNDLPLLKRVSNPVAVDPDETLERHARQQRWQIISLRKTG